MNVRFNFILTSFPLELYKRGRIPHSSILNGILIFQSYFIYELLQNIVLLK